MALTWTHRWPLIALAGYWLVLLAAMHAPNVSGADVPGKDKTLHFLAYAVLAGLLLNVLTRRAWPPRGRPMALTIVLLVSLYGALDEWTQPYTERSCDFFDWLADLAAALSVGIIYLLAATGKPVKN